MLIRMVTLIWQSVIPTHPDLRLMRITSDEALFRIIQSPEAFRYVRERDDMFLDLILKMLQWELEKRRGGDEILWHG